jgi:hypothetical protein
MGKRKYEEIKGYWVYSIQVPSINKYYIGVSKLQCSQRWRKSTYKGLALEPYLDEWDSMIKTVLVDNLTKEQAYQYEDNIIRALQMNDLCINKQRSGLIEVSDKNAYNRELLKNNIEYRERQKQRANQWQKDNKEKKREYNKQRYERKKLEKQNQQMSLF